MTTSTKQTTTETLPKSLDQVLATAARVFEDPAASSFYMETAFGEVRVVRANKPGQDHEVYMASQEYRDFCRFLNNR